MTRAVAAGIAGLLVLTGCGDSGSDDSASVTTVDASVVVEVRVRDNQFQPAELEVEAGTTIRFENVGRNDHDVVGGDGAPDGFGVDVADLGPDMTAERPVTEPGTFTYYCSLHGTATAGMVATITVTG